MGQTKARMVMTLMQYILKRITCQQSQCSINNIIGSNCVHVIMHDQSRNHYF